MRLPSVLTGMALLAALPAPVSAQGSWTCIPLAPPGTTWSAARAASGNRLFGNAAFVGQSGFTPMTWDGAGTPIPMGSAPGSIEAAFGGFQGGVWGGHASLWAGTPESRIDLHPQGMYASRVDGMWESQQAGMVQLGQNGPVHAAVWQGSAQSVIDLHPQWATGPSQAWATDGQMQGGYAVGPNGHRAVLWSGSAASVIDLTPPNSGFAEVTGMVPGQQAGFASVPGQGDHAMLWHGSAASMTDLHPVGIAGFSRLYGTCGSAQAGVANTFQLGITAGVWFGTPESFAPLSPYLPPGYVNSVATSISFHDGLYYIGGYADNFATFFTEAVMWVGIPAPGSALVLAAAAGTGLRRRRAC
jgi:hypothetical protein